MGKQPTKNNLIMILDVLKRHSDADHRLTQKDIQHYLKQDHELNCDRKTVKRNLMNLVEYGFDIEFKEIERGGKGSKKNVTADTPTVKTKANEDEENGWWSRTGSRYSVCSLCIDSRTDAFAFS